MACLEGQCAPGLPVGGEAELVELRAYNRLVALVFALVGRPDRGAGDLA